MNNPSPRPHIVLVTSSYPHHGEAGDMCAPFARDFAAALAREARVTVVAAGPQSETTTEREVDLVRFRTPAFPVSRLRFGHPADWPAILGVLRSGQRALDRVLREKPADFVLACWAIPAGWWAMRAAARFGIAYGVWALGSDILIAGRSPLIRPIVRRILNRANLRFADGLALKDEVEHLSGSCRFLPTTRQLPPMPEKPLRSSPPYRLGFLGRLHPVKGVDLLLDALELLAEDDWERIESVRIAGDGPLRDEVEQRCRRLAASGRPVAAIGGLASDGVAEFLHETDYLLIPSRSESIPVVFSEAMQMQCPIIATPVGDLPLLHQQYGAGFIAERITAEALVHAIHGALASTPQQLQNSLSLASRAFDLNRSVRDLLSEAALLTGG